MGSFASSVQIRSSDAKEVVESVQNSMRDAGYGVSDEHPDELEMSGMPSALRALHVGEAREGWVGILDSDLMNSTELAGDLSRRLETFSIAFMVNDSDSWHYALFHNGLQIDEFDSSGGATDDMDMDDLPDEFAQMLADGGIEQKMKEMQQQIEQEIPQEIREIQERMQTGAATQDELVQFNKFMETFSQRYMSEINELMAGFAPALSNRSVPEPELNHHLEKLRPVVPPDVPDSQVVEVLGKQAVFMEQILGEFMTLFGIPAVFADLSYRYLQEYAESELADQDVAMIAHLKFKNESIAI